VRGEKFVAVGGEAEVMRLAGGGTRLVNAGGRRIIPGLNDSHLHVIRGCLNRFGLTSIVDPGESATAYRTATGP
jgi:predicted amidohydrolase YtcJ